MSGDRMKWGEILCRRVAGAADPAAELRGLSRKDLRAMTCDAWPSDPEGELLGLALYEAARRYLKPKQKQKNG